MRRVLMSVLLALSLSVISFQFSPILNSANLAYSSVNPTHISVFRPNIDPLEGG